MRRLSLAVALPPVLLLVALACGSDAGQRRPASDSWLVRRLDGTWDLTLRLDRPMTLSTDPRSLPRSVTGIVAILERRAGQLSFPQMSAPTHIGVYDIDLSAIGFASRDVGVIPGLAARAGSPDRTSVRADRDSFYIVLNPETPRHSLYVTGIFTGDSGSGVWIAESFLGGGGTFTLRRRLSGSTP